MPVDARPGKPPVDLATLETVWQRVRHHAHAAHAQRVEDQIADLRAVIDDPPAAAQVTAGLLQTLQAG